MTAQLVATVPGSGCELRILREHGVVAITDGRAITTHTVPTLQAANARELVGLLDRAMADDAPTGLVGSVLMSSGRLLHVKRWGYAVGLSTHPNPAEHGGWTFTMVDQVRGLRDALSRAVGGDAPRARSAPVDDRDTAERMNARPHERATPPTHTAGTAPARSAPGMKRA